MPAILQAIRKIQGRIAEFLQSTLQITIEFLPTLIQEILQIRELSNTKIIEIIIQIVTVEFHPEAKVIRLLKLVLIELLIPMASKTLPRAPDNLTSPLELDTITI